MFTFIIIALIAHWVADFVYSTENATLNKRHKWIILAYHSIFYSTIVIVIINYFTPQYVSPRYLVTLYLSYFIINAITNKINTNLWKRNEKLGFNQLLHLIILMLPLCGYK